MCTSFSLTRWLWVNAGGAKGRPCQTSSQMDMICISVDVVYNRPNGHWRQIVPQTLITQITGLDLFNQKNAISTGTALVKTEHPLLSGKLPLQHNNVPDLIVFRMCLWTGMYVVYWNKAYTISLSIPIWLIHEAPAAFASMAELYSNWSPVVVRSDPVLPNIVCSFIQVLLNIVMYVLCTWWYPNLNGS